MNERRLAAIGARGAAWSLEYRLPLLLSALLALVVSGFSLAAYREVRATAISRSADRLERVGRELTLSAARGTEVRWEALRALAADPAIVRTLDETGATPETSAAIAARLIAERRADSVLIGWEIATVSGEPRVRSDARLTARDSVMLESTRALALSSGTEQRSVLYGSAEQVHAWSVVPVVVGGRTAGTLAELRRLGNSSRSAETIRELVGEDVRLYYTSRGSSEWASLNGRLTPAPFATPPIENRAVTLAGADGERHYVVLSPVARTPWLVVLAQSEASVLRRAQEFLRNMLGVGLMLLAVATLGAWTLSRYVTRPLRDVTRAAAALAQGDYAQRVSANGSGGDELDGLATTFNAMAAGIGDAHAALEERNAELHRANAAKAQFLAMMSHELRTPLNAIGGFTELIELGLRGPVTTEQIEDLARIRRNKDHLLSIITDILNFARADAGALSLALVRVPLATVLSDVVDALGHQMAAKGVRLVLEPVPRDAIAWGDREKVQQIALNLLSNALKFTDAGGEVTISTAVQGRSVRIDFRDTGPGIEPSQLDDIFEPFVQLDSSLTRRAGGTGLGLAIARHLVSAMGGALTVASRMGEGSTFSVTLPHADRVRSATPGASPMRQVAGETR